MKLLKRYSCSLEQSKMDFLSFGVQLAWNHVIWMLDWWFCFCHLFCGIVAHFNLCEYSKSSTSPFILHGDRASGVLGSTSASLKSTFNLWVLVCIWVNVCVWACRGHHTHLSYFSSVSQWEKSMQQQQNINAARHFWGKNRSHFVHWLKYEPA